MNLNNRKQTMKALLSTIVAAGTLFAYAPSTGSAHLMAPHTMILAPESRLWFDGTPTVKAFSCSATKFDAAVEVKTGAKPEALVESAAIKVPVSALDCKNGTMNDHMRKALKASTNPEITWRMTSYRVQGTAVVMQGRLSIAGKENDLELNGTGTAANGVIRIKGSKQFKMTEFGVKPPKLMMGAMKVKDPVTVGFDIVLNP